MLRRNQPLATTARPSSLQVPTAHGKADLTIYRQSGAQVMAILSGLAVCERASIDEAYLDLTEEAGRRLRALPAGAPPAVPSSLEGWHVCGLVRARYVISRPDAMRYGTVWECYVLALPPPPAQTRLSRGCVCLSSSRYGVVSPDCFYALCCLLPCISVILNSCITHGTLE